VAVVGRTLVASTSGKVSEVMGWIPFWLLTTVITLPALVLLIWIGRQDSKQAERQLPIAASTPQRV
jgi:PAT family beta-lactamase induction signal transducer AmpG